VATIAGSGAAGRALPTEAVGGRVNVLATQRCRPICGHESDADSGPTYVPTVGSHDARTPEELAEVFAGFPERIVELRQRAMCAPLTSAEQEQLRAFCGDPRKIGTLAPSSRLTVRSADCECVLVDGSYSGVLSFGVL
jgi:hypothetical protein